MVSYVMARPLDKASNGQSFNKDWMSSFAAKPLASLPNSTGSIRPLTVLPLLDLTSLSGEENEKDIVGLVQTAKRPVANSPEHHVAAICILPEWLTLARTQLEGVDIRLATVAGDFPWAEKGFDQRCDEVKNAIKLGADELDIVVPCSLIVQGNWRTLYDEIVDLRDICQSKTLKIILETAAIKDHRCIANASLVSLMAGADYIKTSTGQYPQLATLSDGLAILQAIEEYYKITGQKKGFKAAGGIRTLADATGWYLLVQRYLGESWCGPNTFRIGASSLLEDIINKDLNRR